MTENGFPEALHPQCPRSRASCSRQCPLRGPIDSAGGGKPGLLWALCQRQQAGSNHPPPHVGPGQASGTLMGTNWGDLSAEGRQFVGFTTKL